MSEAPTDWEQQTTAALKLRSDLGDAEAMRLLALPHAQLWACSARSATTPTGNRSPTAGEVLARDCAKNRKTLLATDAAGDMCVHYVAYYATTNVGDHRARSHGLTMLQCIVEKAGILPASVVVYDGGRRRG